ncbi:protein jag [Propionibacterium acidifaciens]|uniref:Jag family protein n=1 Tax=Propionibacterium acidifaciens TaxID=556499 RepID=UPI0023F3C381|nr:R3H domain-containing nucleic acid-binding protein [Propionibacterium acidifaciens]
MSESTEHEELVDETPSEDAVDGAPAEGADEEDTAEAPAADADGQRSRKDEREEELVAEGDIAADYLEELLDIADMDGDIDTYTEGDRAHVSVVTEDETLVGRDGEVLEALQELSRLAVMTETGHRSRLMLDIAGHREKHRKELQLLAQDAINEVNETGEPVRLSPMNPFERKIVHDAVAAAGLFSESEGTEPQRRVVVQPAR